MKNEIKYILEDKKLSPEEKLICITIGYYGMKLTEKNIKKIADNNKDFTNEFVKETIGKLMDNNYISYKLVNEDYYLILNDFSYIEETYKKYKNPDIIKRLTQYPVPTVGEILALMYKKGGENNS